MSHPIIPTEDDKAHFMHVATSHGRSKTETSGHASEGGWFAKWRKRVTTERMVIRKACRDALAAGYSITVDYGEGDDSNEAVKSTDLDAIMKAIMACDMEWLNFYKGDEFVGQVALIYDNGDGGATVISDYHMSLEEVLKGANELADKILG